MANRILSSARNFVSAFGWSRIAYRQAHETDTTELAQLTATNTNNGSTTDLVDSPAQPFRRPILGGLGKSGWSRRYISTFTGWKFGALHFATWAAIVFLINVISTIWGSVYQRSAGSLSEGDCGRIKNLNRGLHIFINILSTILLSGSNYCMQCLSAPTRADVDKAHASRTWLDVGVPSIRNLKHISRRRLYLWLLLGSSSVPLHLFYNSAVYASISTNDYYIYLVSEAFLDDPECHNCTSEFWDPIDGYYPQYNFTGLNLMWNLSRQGLLDRLEPAGCLAAYSTALQSERRNVLLVMDDAQAKTGFYNRNLTDINNTNVYWFDHFTASSGTDPSSSPDSYNWICSGIEYDRTIPCANRVGAIKNAPETWKVGQTGSCNAGWDDCHPDSRWPVKYCLSEPAVPRCRLHFSPAIASIVTILNLFKAILMCFVIRSTKKDPLLTMGDAVASFLNERDPTTPNLSLLTLHDCKKDYDASPKPWHEPRSRWKDTTSKKRRGVTLGLFATAIVVIISLLVRGVMSITLKAYLGSTAIFNLGFGAIDTRALITEDGDQFPTDMIRLVLIANLPQVILSFLYFAYNGLFTAMLLGYEWTSYAHKQKGLRVSHVPSGSQRSTYFLQLPYRFGLPLVVLSGTLHWLVSQSIFVVSMDVYDLDGYYYGATNMCGFSPIAMLVVVLLGIVMVAAVVAFGYIPYESGMPLAGSCSLAISAACHPEEDTKDEDLVSSEQKLQWGVVSISPDGIGHCAFSSKEVGPLVNGRMYA